MGTAIDMSGVCWDVKPWNRVMEHVKVSAQGVPSNLRNAIAAFVTMNGSKLKWSMNEGISVGEVQILSIREETMLFGIGLRCVGWSNVMSVCGRGGAKDVILTVVLEPELLVDSIITGIGRMREVEVHQIMAIHHAGGIEGHSVFKSHMDQMPFINISRTYGMGDEEELVQTCNDALNQDISWRNLWC